jgi:serine/threonine protein kinase
MSTTETEGAAVIHQESDQRTSVIANNASQPTPPSRAPIPRSYQVIDGLGVGGFATVVKVEEVNSKQRFAMKVISKKKVQKHMNLEQLTHEVHVMKTLNSPFIQKCHDTFETEGQVFFVVDLISGGDIFYHLSVMNQGGTSPKGFPEPTARILLAEVYLGLAHMHSHNFIHRDLKIENIMLDHTGHVKIIDFGVSSPLSVEGDCSSSAQQLEHEQSLVGCGTLSYTSPEMIMHRKGGRHTDWWALGVVAYEVLTGTCPWSYSSNDVNALKNEIINKLVTPPMYLKVNTTMFIHSLLNKDFKKRLGTKTDEEIKEAPFFDGINWEAMKNLQHTPAFVVDTSRANVDLGDRKRSLELYHQMCFTQSAQN